MAPPVAVGACFAIVVGMMLTVHGHGFFLERMRTPVREIGVIACACVGIVLSLFLPWVRDARVLEGGGALPPATLTAWNASGSAATWLLSIAIGVGLATIAGALSRRAGYAMLALAGWSAAAFAVTTPLLARGLSRPPFELPRVVVGYGPGYYLGLGCATVIVLAGLLTAASGPARAAVP